MRRRPCGGIRVTTSVTCAAIVVQALGARYRDAVVAVAHEVQVPDAVDVDRWHRLATALRLRDALPALAQPRRRRVEVAVEVARAVDGADDRVDVDDAASPSGALAGAAERLDDLLEREDHADVVGLAAQARRQQRQGPAAPGAGEVRLGVRPW